MLLISITVLMAPAFGPSTIFGLDTINVTCNGVKDGAAFICVVQRFFASAQLDSVTLQWKDSMGVTFQTTTFDDEGFFSDKVTNLCAGDYTLEYFTVLNPVPTILPFTITEPPAITIKCKIVKALCTPSRASIKAVVSNAQGGVTYRWTNMHEKVIGTHKILKNVLPNNCYSIEVTDSLGCKAFKCCKLTKSKPLCIKDPLLKCRNNKCQNKKNKK